MLFRSGTTVGGLAGLSAMSLEEFGYKILDVENSPEKDFEKTVIYNITPEEKPDALKEIRRILDANIAQSIPKWMKDEIGDEKPDFVIVVGKKIEAEE